MNEVRVRVDKVETGWLFPGIDVTVTIDGVEHVRHLAKGRLPDGSIGYQELVLSAPDTEPIGSTIGSAAGCASVSR